MNIHICIHIQISIQAPEETLYCSACKQHIAPVKKFDVWAAPDVLILHLKRFQFTPGQYFVHREKTSDVVKFPVEGFDLSTFVKGALHF
jgi:ubiquitin C-terminal hydrolase